MYQNFGVKAISRRKVLKHNHNYTLWFTRFKRVIPIVIILLNGRSLHQPKKKSIKLQARILFIFRDTSRPMFTRTWERWRWMNREGRSERQILAAGKAYKATLWPTPDSKERNPDCSWYSVEGIPISASSGPRGYIGVEGKLTQVLFLLFSDEWSWSRTITDGKNTQRKKVLKIFFKSGYNTKQHANYFEVSFSSSSLSS